MRGHQKALTSFIACSVVVGLAALATGDHGWHQIGRHPLVAPLLASLLLVTELMPVTLLHNRSEVEVATSTTFVLALLLFAGIGPALVAQLMASLVADLVQRKSAVKIIFNLAQFAIAIAASGTVLTQLGGPTTLSDGLMGRSEILPVIAASAAFLAIHNFMVWTVVALATGSSLWRMMRGEWTFSTASGLVLVGLAPVVDLVAVKALPMLPLLLIPVGAVYVTARSSVAQAHQALHDGLTGLANRTRFRADVSATLEEQGRMHRPLAVLLVDLDRFKEINDTLGHHTGDVLLCEVGPRLAASSDAVTLVARMGGDEFAVLLADIDGPEQAVEVARKLTQALEEPFVLDDGLMLEVEASIGVVVTPEHGGDVDVLLQRADVAMYLAKASRSGVELYAPERDDNTRRRLTLIGQLRTAIAGNELTLFYQPKLNLASHEFSGVEALIRWFHPQLGTLAPDEFIPLAERSGLIKPLTHFVLQTAIRQAKQWHNDGLPLRVAVNLSARTFLDSDLPSMVGGLLAAADMDPEWLELEITETELMGDPERGAKVLQRLHAMGIRLTIDDFGTGHSSLAYIRSLPVDEIKIDRCFVAAMTGDGCSADDIIVRSTIELACNLGLEVTAEGVETVAQLELLTALGCNFLQGYYLSRPVPPDELFTLLAATSVLARKRSRLESPE
jgi:diguanylate cyclase (GGDEF)-like protein